MPFMKSAKKTKIDPELTRQINSAAANESPIQAVFSLDLPMKKLIDPEQVEKATTQILRRAEEESGAKPEDINIFQNIGSFSVSAAPSFIRKLIDDPGVAAAVANKRKK